MTKKRAEKKRKQHHTSKCPAPESNEVFPHYLSWSIDTYWEQTCTVHCGTLFYTGCEFNYYKEQSLTRKEHKLITRI
jgi:hypothetical protein